MKFRVLRTPKVPGFYFDEAVRDAAFWKSEADKYKRQAKRLYDAAKRTEDDMNEELFRLQQDLAWAQDANACLALENSELAFQIAQIRGDA